MLKSCRPWQDLPVPYDIVKTSELKVWRPKKHLVIPSPPNRKKVPWRVINRYLPRFRMHTVYKQLKNLRWLTCLQNLYKLGMWPVGSAIQLWLRVETELLSALLTHLRHTYNNVTHPGVTQGFCSSKRWSFKRGFTANGVQRKPEEKSILLQIWCFYLLRRLWTARSDIRETIRSLILTRAVKRWIIRLQRISWPYCTATRFLTLHVSDYIFMVCSTL